MEGKPMTTTFSPLQTSAHSEATYDEQDFLLDGQLTVLDIAATLAEAGNANGEACFRKLMPQYFDEYASLPTLRHAR